MAPPNNRLVARVTLVMNRDTRVYNNTWHVERPTAWTPGDLVAIATAFYNWWTASYRACITTAVALANIHVQVYDPLGSPYVYDRPVTPTEAGTRPGNAEAGNVTMAVSLRAGLAGRRYRGRFFIPGLSFSDIATNDQIASGEVVAAAVAATQLIGPALPAGNNLVIFHRSSNTFTPVVNYVAENLVDSQRRRLPGRGR